MTSLNPLTSPAFLAASGLVVMALSLFARKLRGQESPTLPQVLNVFLVGASLPVALGFLLAPFIPGVQVPEELLPLAGLALLYIAYYGLDGLGRKDE